MIIITSGGNFSDIDGLACAVAYQQLLELKGVSAKSVLTGPLNESVTRTVRNWRYRLESSFEGNPNDYGYVLTDISNPEYFAEFVVLDNIVEVYDHRNGFEDYWKQRLGNKAKIESVGACATLIWEEFKKAGLENKIDVVSANLLYTAILSNTLNLQAQITSPRDKNAVDELIAHTDIPNNWRQAYFDEVYRGIMSDPVGSMTNDTKILDINGKQYIITQLELWDSQKFIENNYETIVKVLTDRGVSNTFLTCPSLSQGFNYIVAIDPQLKEKLGAILDAKFDGNIGKTKKLWLRKEIIRLL